jgi:hypothetical protein
MPDEETLEKCFLINDRVKYGLRAAEVNGSVKWLLKEEKELITSKHRSVSRE